MEIEKLGYMFTRTIQENISNPGPNWAGNKQIKQMSPIFSAALNA